MEAAVVLLLLLPLVVAGAWWLAKKRREQLDTWARATGWQHVRHDPGYGLARLHHNQPFEQGHGRRVSEVLTGRWQGLPAVSYTYEWSTGAGKERRTYYAHVVALALPAYLPVLELTGEGVGARIAKALGARDLQTESVAFNDAYRVAAGDERVGHAILHPRLMERLLQPDALRTDWRIEGTWIASWAPGRTDTARIAPRLGVLHAVVRGVPRHVWQEHGYDPLRHPGVPGAC
ncbi:hypothetical protein [Cellulomonas shaoxiangyii]|uniref:DUF3137 domain-containing protein n=1 Tax=Cellulomonas shaoxiangyii TaxID=2566013 RepID=A0A4P7SG65_9CELL|nr:hypothetical protein [Cellulomonas shaoxiangyii]QCB92598.1 hypothetical protein E5225_02555 [Cellulomonas shaoxiangyii]TGY85246.1 hypothetical protein E5226_07500 [Cellulomonas shaoxiangyii]